MRRFPSKGLWKPWRRQALHCVLDRLRLLFHRAQVSAWKFSNSISTCATLRLQVWHFYSNLRHRLQITLISSELQPDNVNISFHGMWDLCSSELISLRCEKQNCEARRRKFTSKIVTHMSAVYSRRPAHFRDAEFFFIDWQKRFQQHSNVKLLARNCCVEKLIIWCDE